jgi:hypothetical protein
MAQGWIARVKFALQQETPACLSRAPPSATATADVKVVVAESMRPGSRVVISWNSQPLPSGSWNDANER